MRTVVGIVGNVNNLYGHTLTLVQIYVCVCGRLSICVFVYMSPNRRLVFVLCLCSCARVLRYLFASASVHSGSIQGLPLISANPSAVNSFIYLLFADVCVREESDFEGLNPDLDTFSYPHLDPDTYL